jgi:hypothetical protein
VPFFITGAFSSWKLVCCLSPSFSYPICFPFSATCPLTPTRPSTPSSPILILFTFLFFLPPFPTVGGSVSLQLLRWQKFIDPLFPFGGSAISSLFLTLYLLSLSLTPGLSSLSSRKVLATFVLWR